MSIETAVSISSIVIVRGGTSLTTSPGPAVITISPRSLAALQILPACIPYTAKALLHFGRKILWRETLVLAPSLLSVLLTLHKAWFIALHTSSRHHSFQTSLKIACACKEEHVCTPFERCVGRYEKILQHPWAIKIFSSIPMKTQQTVSLVCILVA